CTRDGGGGFGFNDPSFDHW
nr:immunoglobulin heavy chain junction region [Macaca mulatta]MOW98355.1 immunoglobulin heavy chain junction region [Macaca mulatta]MOW98838.1 immunoglobulin heavy chain junction region [Macaca mulatta]MOW98913.1 immunoglobulin heavy chain junction region [Macaca mulatta]MOW99142.1 immunoglobulin heavy chain junction region [Macaca mulatta]